ncbi:S1C family serine protease [Planococcus lenghuensis]|uniref:2-alkenal reductase n=1 Tax=Planococcus lenghuensis TaxID=2213202 RepID=A0A1Q2L1V4_9BACL|nr:trypsin-like peptidase domain-containing protein [Planococcus lenghuensis]AQQ54440.1 2-alkenal reductase [Planococcus lenghuensis]
MGYYDQSQVRRKRGGRGGYFASSLSGVLAGALLIGVVVPGVTDEQPAVTAVAPVESASNVAGAASNTVTDVSSVVEQTSPAIVGVTNLQTAPGNAFMQTSSELQAAGTGSGVVYKKTGDYSYIVTNHHVVANAEEVKITLSDGTEIDGKLLGSDALTDLAVVQVKSEAVETVAEIGDSSTLKAGEPVIAIGNPLGLQFSNSVTTGVVSGTDRSIAVDVNKDGSEDWQAQVIQTDAAINPGNSGGALLNNAGELVGINSMKIATAAVEGMGLAIPINEALPIIEDLEDQGEVQRPSLGVTIMDLANVQPAVQERDLNLPEGVEEGVVLESIQPGSAADAAGLQPLDVIIGFNGKDIPSSLELRQYLYTEAAIGDTLDVEIVRDGQVQTVKLVLTETLS